MIKPVLTLAALLTAGTFVSAASAAPVKAAPKASSKMVTLYQADKCHMYFTPAQAKMDHYACPDSKGKMHIVKLSPTAAKAALAPK